MISMNFIVYFRNFGKLIIYLSTNFNVQMYKFDAWNSAIPNFWKQEMSKLFCQLIGKMVY